MKVVEFAKRVNKDDSKLTPNDILAGAANLLDVVLVIGVDTEGFLFFSSSTESRPEIVDLLKQIEHDIYSDYGDD
jgi:hypothetical protein